MSPATTILRTKLHPPFTRPGLVVRPRLQDQVACGLRGPLTLIIAPAGFGKTTLAAACVAAGQMPVAWLSLDAEDNLEGRFLAYLAAALQSAQGRIGADAAQLLSGLQPAPAEAVLTSLINDLDSAGIEMALVLDDYQVIKSQPVHAAVAFLLDHCPPTFHLLITSRSDPPLPIARLRARGQVVELRAADLRFTTAEASRFMNEVMSLQLDEGSVEALEERTEGWVAGLQMAALSMRDRPNVREFIQGFSGSHRHILDYLLEEVLAVQTPEIQHFLLCTSILERLTAGLCEAILPQDGPTVIPRASASVLDYLERENLFLLALDDERTWFRYHHLFADLLRGRLQQAHPEWVPGLHRRASAWLEQAGHIPEAVRHLLSIHEVEQAAGLIETYGPARWAERDPSIVQMADSLPFDRLIARPKLAIYFAWLQTIHGKVMKAIPVLNALAVAEPASGQAWLRTIALLALVFLNRPVKTSASDPLPDYQALEEIPAGEVILRDTAEVIYGMTLGRRGEIDRAAQIAEKTIERQKALAATTGTIPALVPFLARVYLMQGRLDSATAISRQTLLSLQETSAHLIYSAGSMKINLGEVFYERNDLTEAEPLIRSGLQDNEPWSDVITDGFGWLALIRLLTAKGDIAGAMQYVEKFEAKMQGQTGPVEFAEDHRTLRARVLLAAGDLSEAVHWADRVIQSEDYQIHPKYYRVVLAHIRLPQGRYQEAEQMLQGLSTRDLAGNRIHREIEAKLLLAAALAGQQRLPEALTLVDTCLALAEPQGYVRVFLEMGEPVRNLLSAYLRLEEPPHQPFARRLLSDFSKSDTTNATDLQTGGLVEPLSGREIEVLQLMALGCTNQEIARQLIVAPGTIKAHAANIYRKLDAANRTEAVARARELGILS